MNRLIFWKSLMVASLIGLAMTACSQSTAPSTQNPVVMRQRFPDPTPITPDLVLQHVGYTEADVPYQITARIRNPNDCDTTTWEVDAPDTLPEGTLGCDLGVVFKASSTETHEVRVSTVNYLGQVVTETAKVFVPRPGNTLSDYPLIDSPRLNSHQITSGSTDCVTSAVSDGAEMDLRGSGCGINQTRYSASVTLTNPTNQALTYAWKLEVTHAAGGNETIAQQLNDVSYQNNPVFTINKPGKANTVPVTEDCRVQIKVDPIQGGKPIPSGSDYKTVWQGRCTYYTVGDAIIKFIGLISWELDEFGHCVAKDVPNGATIDMADLGCQPDINVFWGQFSPRYAARAVVDNQTGYQGDYDWHTNAYSSGFSSDAIINLGYQEYSAYFVRVRGPADVVTIDCVVGLHMTGLSQSLNAGILPVWAGRCTF